jgi:hypothetical protein
MAKSIFHNILREVMKSHSRLITLVFIALVAFSCAEKRDLTDLICGNDSKLWYVNPDPRSKFRRCFYFNRDGTWKMLVRDLQGNLTKYDQYDHLWPEYWILKDDSVISLGGTEYKIHEVNPSLLILHVDTTKITLQLVNQ